MKLWFARYQPFQLYEKGNFAYLEKRSEWILNISNFTGSRSPLERLILTTSFETISTKWPQDRPIPDLWWRWTHQRRNSKEMQIHRETYGLVTQNLSLTIAKSRRNLRKNNHCPWEQPRKECLDYIGSIRTNWVSFRGNFGDRDLGLYKLHVLLALRHAKATRTHISSKIWHGYLSRRI